MFCFFFYTSSTKLKYLEHQNPASEVIPLIPFTFVQRESDYRHDRTSQFYSRSNMGNIPQH